MTYEDNSDNWEDWDDPSEEDKDPAQWWMNESDQGVDPDDTRTWSSPLEESGWDENTESKSEDWKLFNTIWALIPPVLARYRVSKQARNNLREVFRDLLYEETKFDKGLLTSFDVEFTTVQGINEYALEEIFTLLKARLPQKRWQRKRNRMSLGPIQVSEKTSPSKCMEMVRYQLLVCDYPHPDEVALKVIQVLGQGLDNVVTATDFWEIEKELKAVEGLSIEALDQITMIVSKMVVWEDQPKIRRNDLSVSVPLDEIAFLIRWECFRIIREMDLESGTEIAAFEVVDEFLLEYDPNNTGPRRTMSDVRSKLAGVIGLSLQEAQILEDMISNCILPSGEKVA